VKVIGQRRSAPHDRQANRDESQDGGRKARATDPIGGRCPPITF
jgi:hypothetical protein